VNDTKQKRELSSVIFHLIMIRRSHYITTVTQEAQLSPRNRASSAHYTGLVYLV